MKFININERTLTMKFLAKGYAVAALLIILYLGMTLVGFSIWQGYPRLNLPYIPPFFEVLCIFCAEAAALAGLVIAIKIANKGLNVIAAIGGHTILWALWVYGRLFGAFKNVLLSMKLIKE
jgi:hypothetical protein